VVYPASQSEKRRRNKKSAKVSCFGHSKRLPLYSYDLSPSHLGILAVTASVYHTLIFNKKGLIYKEINEESKGTQVKICSFQPFSKIKRRIKSIFWL
jgi:hypothetical protein